MKSGILDPIPPVSGGTEADGRFSETTTLTIDVADVVRPGPSDPRPDSPLRRLVPFSGVQFIDLEIDAGILPMLSAWFTEELIDTPVGHRRVLLPLATDQTPDGSIFHPVTFRPLGPADTLSYSGLEAVEPFLDAWTPLPFLRYLGRGASGEARYDQGPSNWARLFIERPAEGLRAAERLRAVLAFDTRLESTSGAGTAAYLAPSVEDALFASTFLLVDNPELLSSFVSQPWIDAWLREVTARSTRAGHGLDFSGGAGLADSERFTLAHLARYLALLKVLERAAETPRIRFVDSVSKSLPLPASGLDLIVDFGSSETVALLVPREIPLDPGTAADMATGLRLRDLTRPTQVHTGPIANIVEFDHQSFGNAALSRRSGRADAFAWGSLVRIGEEARRLGLRTNAVEGLTGGDDLQNRIGETAASHSLWRFSTPDGATARTGPMVSGEALRHLSEDGELVQRPELLLTGSAAGGVKAQAPATSTPVVRPRFSHSSLGGFFLAELLLHALGWINSADPQGPLAREAAGANEVRRIERIIVTSPLAMPAEQRHLLIERVHNAIDLVWRTQRLDDPAAGPYRDKPTVALSIGGDVGLQLIHLYDQVRAKFGSSFGELVDCLRRRTGGLDARDELRVASIEAGERSLGLTVMDYDVGHGGTVEVALVSTDRATQGTQRVVDALSETLILPAIERALAAAGISDPRQFLADLPDADTPQRGQARAGGGGGLLARRIERKILQPAAAQLFAYYASLPPRAGSGIDRTRLDALASAGRGRLDPMCEEFNALAAAAGARGFDLAAVVVASSRRQFEALLESELWPAIDAACEAIHAMECDLVLVGGAFAGLPDLMDRLLMHSPVPPGRIEVISEPGLGSSGVAAGARTSAVMGAYMASRNLLSADGFALATRKVCDALASDTTSSHQALPREGPDTRAIDAWPGRVEQLG